MLRQTCTYSHCSLIGALPSSELSAARASCAAARMRASILVCASARPKKLAHRNSQSNPKHISPSPVAHGQAARVAVLFVQPR